MLEDLDAKLSPTEKAHDLALQALLEDKLYFYQVGLPHPNASPCQPHVRESIFLETQRLTTLSGRTTRDGTRTIIPCEGKSFQRCLFRCRYLSVCSPTVESAGLFTVRARCGTRRKKLARLESISGRTSTRFSLHRKRRRRLAPVTRFSGSGEGRGRRKRIRLFSALLLRGLFVPRKFLPSTITWRVIVLTAFDRAPETQQVVRSFPAVVDYARRIHSRYFPDYAALE